MGLFLKAIYPDAILGNIGLESTCCVVTFKGNAPRIKPGMAVVAAFLYWLFLSGASTPAEAPAPPECFDSITGATIDCAAEHVASPEQEGLHQDQDLDEEYDEEF